MLARISGTLVGVDDERILVEMGPVTVEALIPACDAPDLEASIGQRVERFTLLLLEGAGVGSTLSPRLLAFESTRDRAFFELFTTVKNIGHRKAMRALVKPVGEVAQAIAGRDIAQLTTLPGIGKRAAETIIAELAGKLDAFLEGHIAPVSGDPTTSALIEDTVTMLMALGEQRATALAMVERARAQDPSLDTPESMLAAVYETH
ncbi:MAG: helix-hairpin-helix domain-containing protein [Phycisphaerales bacterium]|nr:helix-hairpin-helix domain-containing protein [Phycisphaerales bacterium]